MTKEALGYRSEARTRRLAAPLTLLAALAIAFAEGAAAVDRHSGIPTLSKTVSFCPFDDFALHATLSLPALPSLPAPATNASPPKLPDTRNLSSVNPGIPLSRAPPQALAAKV